jgi:hypothetical protein
MSDGSSVVNSEWYQKHLQLGNVGYFGRLNPDDLDSFWYLYFELEEAEQQGRLAQKFAEQGLTGGKDEFGAIWAAFIYRHFGNLNYEQQQRLALQSMMNARNRQAYERFQRALASDPSLTAPVDGVTVEQWAQASAALAQEQDVAGGERALAQLGIDRAKYDRINAEYQARMQRDESLVIAQLYGKAFSHALGVQGGYGLGYADGSAQKLGQEPCSFERYCEITAAQSAWAHQGRDVNAMLHQVFGIAAIDISKYGAYWSTKFAADPNLALRFSELLHKYEAKYERGGGGYDDNALV